MEEVWKKKSSNLLLLEIVSIQTARQAVSWLMAGSKTAGAAAQRVQHEVGTTHGREWLGLDPNAVDQAGPGCKIDSGLPGVAVSRHLSGARPVRCSIASGTADTLTVGIRGG